jgi:hypothetical protein
MPRRQAAKTRKPMNLQKLKQAEAEFLFRYPGGFNHPDMVEIGKKHKVGKMVEMCQEQFRQHNFARPQAILDNLVQVVSRSSMVSMFEKPKFRSFVNSLGPMEKELLAHSLEERLHGNEQQGFEIMLELLQSRKMGKWTLMSICPLYFNPDHDVFVKPTTVKGIIKYLELDELEYRPAPSWEFYTLFRQRMNECKEKVDSSLSPNNAAFTGFLMMSL